MYCSDSALSLEQLGFHGITLLGLLIFPSPSTSPLMENFSFLSNHLKIVETHILSDVNYPLNMLSFKISTKENTLDLHETLLDSTLLFSLTPSFLFVPL